MTREQLARFSHEAASLLARLQAAPADLDPLRAKINEAHLPRQFNLAKELSGRLRVALSDDDFRLAQAHLRSQTGIDPGFFLSAQAEAAMRLMIKGRVTTTFEYRVLRQCLDENHFSGDCLASVVRLMRTRTRVHTVRTGH